MQYYTRILLLAYYPIFQNNTKGKNQAKEQDQYTNAYTFLVYREEMIADIVVIGAGAIGCSASYYLSKCGFKVVVVEKNELASGASGANAGMVSCLAPETVRGRFRQHCWQILFGLSEELDIDMEFSVMGGVDVTFEEEMWKTFKERVKTKKSPRFPLELLGAQELRKLIPGISPRVKGGIYYPYRGPINPLKLTYG